MSLEHARDAVDLDSSSENVEAAVAGYALSVALISEVMERVRAENSTAKEENLIRLQNLHDTYGDRMSILCLIHNLQKPEISYQAAILLTANHTDHRYYDLSQPVSTDSESLTSYSVASSRTDESDYGLFYTRRALSHTSEEY
ncbi:hypothetical protein JR316_0001640 [Psilocybe cubensis]|uniref:Uncharacterized protein n=1 Tax=Psilocybe cubensis TaxID=181762 RepID=A0ACB8HAI3_PSICU|nr:hypothetical protein JR316_0001640 [Psilocybe cubensis]KAH9484740.1 hypothetical protein JR316_0001640 [Psilocybe cubensis]